MGHSQNFTSSKLIRVRECLEEFYYDSMFTVKVSINLNSTFLCHFLYFLLYDKLDRATELPMLYWSSTSKHLNKLLQITRTIGTVTTQNRGL